MGEQARGNIERIAREIAELVARRYGDTIRQINEDLTREVGERYAARIRNLDLSSTQAATAEIARLARREVDRIIDPELKELSARVMRRAKERSEG
jgi:hypothetical protein